MTYYIRLPGQEYFSKPCSTVEEARLWAIKNWDKVKIRLNKFYAGFSDRAYGVPIYSSQGAKKPSGFVVGADAFYYATVKNGEVTLKQILRNGKLKR